MDAENILKENITYGENNDLNNELDEMKLDRLSSIVAGGESKQYLGKEYQMSDIDKMTPEQINKL